MNIVKMRRATAITLLCACGCGRQSGVESTSQSTLPVGYVKPAATDNLPLVDHPEYVAWSRFAVGAGVVRKKDVTNEFGAVRVTTTIRLLEKTSNKVVVQSQITVERAGEPTVENPPQTAEFPAKFRLPPTMKLELFALPSLKAKQLDDQTRQACGRGFETQLFTWQEFSERGPMTIKHWRTDDVPGRMLRQEVTGPQHNSVEEVVEITLPKT